MPRKKARASSCSPWPALPPDIAREVLLRLPSYADRICFGAACRSWRASARKNRLPPRLPCIVFVDGTFGAFPEGDRPFRLPRAAGHQGSCGPWLVFKRYDGRYSLLNPFTMAAMPPLPSPSAARAHDEPVGAVGERDVDEYDVNGLVLLRGRDGAVEPEPRTLSVRKLVVFSPGLVAAVIGEGRLGKFALCRPWATSWSVCGHDKWRRLKDMVMHQGKLYAVDHNEDLLAVTVGEDSGGALTVSGIGRVIEGDPPSLAAHRRLTLHYLVDSGAELLMVRREVCQGRPQMGVGVEEWFTVFKADLPSSRWVEVSTLGDGMALFVGHWGSRAVRAPDEHRKEWTNLIFFLDDGASDQRLWSPLYKLSAYDMRYRVTYSILPVKSQDGDDFLPVTWLFPEEGTRLAAR